MTCPPVSLWDPEAGYKLGPEPWAVIHFLGSHSLPKGLQVKCGVQEEKVPGAQPFPPRPLSYVFLFFPFMGPGSPEEGARRECFEELADSHLKHSFCDHEFGPWLWRGLMAVDQVWGTASRWRACRTVS